MPVHLSEEFFRRQLEQADPAAGCLTIHKEQLEFLLDHAFMSAAVNDENRHNLDGVSYLLSAPDQVGIESRSRVIRTGLYKFLVDSTFPQIQADEFMEVVPETKIPELLV